MGKRKITKSQIEEMQKMRDDGVQCKEIASLFGVSPSFISEKTCDSNDSFDENWRQKANWPEWEEWRILHKKYGTRKTGADPDQMTNTETVDTEEAGTEDTAAC